MADPGALPRGESLPRPSGGPWRWHSGSLLGSLSEHSLVCLLGLGRTKQYLAGETMIREGETTTFVLALLDGVVKETGLTLDGKEALFAIRVGGDVVGEESAMDGRPRPATITTCGPVVARVIRQADFLTALRVDRELSDANNRAILTKLRQANERRVEFAGYDAPTRIARVLRELAVRYADRAGERIVIAWPLSQTELASLAAVSAPAAHKALRMLRERGVISTGYRTLTIRDFAELDRIAGRL